LVLAEGVRKAGSLDAGQVAAALHGSTVDSLAGRLTYDEKGDVTDPTVYIYQVQDNAFVQVRP
jgi:branched-chain amino acid transport system substrate-binding protein